MGATTNEDWIDNLFVDDLAKWRDYLRIQMEWAKMDSDMWNATFEAIGTAGKEELYRISQDIANFMDDPDPRRQFLDRIKIM